MHPRTSSSGLIVFAILHHVAWVVSMGFAIMSLVDSYDATMWGVFGMLFGIPVAVFYALRIAEARGRQDQKVNEGFALTSAILSASICLSILAGPFSIVFLWQTIGAVKDLENS